MIPRFTRWDQSFNTIETNRVLFEISGKLADRINEPLKSQIIAACAANDLNFLVNLSCDSAQSAFEYAAIFQIRSFFSKRSDLSFDGIDPAQVAKKSFQDAEVLCRESNTILKSAREGQLSLPPHLDSIILIAKRKIARILGSVPTLSSLDLRFGPGATTSTKKRMSSSRRKLSSTIACSESLLPMEKLLRKQMPLWLSDEASTPVVLHNCRIAFVPKNFKSHRVIAVEPVLNTLVQSGVGRYLAKRLKKFGISIYDQNINRCLAQDGSRSGALATLDLTSASDTISFELVRDLLPPDWFTVLSYFRSGSYDLDGESRKLEMFSTAGNGFTFPLETLVFWSLTSAILSHFELPNTLSVYGDDIIIDCQGFDLVVKYFKYLGFIPNVKKSFSTGPFRESCGGYYYLGIDVRPSFQKTALTGQDAFRHHNYFHSIGDEELSTFFLSLIDESIRIYGPAGFGDGHLISDCQLLPHNRIKGWSGYTFETYTFKGRWDFKSLPFDFVFPSYSIYASSIEPSTSSYYRHSVDGALGVSIPGVRGYKRIKVYTL